MYQTLIDGKDTDLGCGVGYTLFWELSHNYLQKWTIKVPNEPQIPSARKCLGGFSKEIAHELVIGMSWRGVHTLTGWYEERLEVKGTTDEGVFWEKPIVPSQLSSRAA